MDKRECDETDYTEQWEYLDHTADVQIHSWGGSLAEAFAQSALGMWGYMTDLRCLREDPALDRIITAQGACALPGLLRDVHCGGLLCACWAE